MQEKLIPYQENGLWGFKLDNEVLISPVYDDISKYKTSDLFYKVRKGDCFGIISSEHWRQLKCEHKKIDVYKQGYVLTTDDKEKWGNSTLYDKSLNKIITMVDEVISLKEDTIVIQRYASVLKYEKDDKGQWVKHPERILQLIGGNNNLNKDKLIEEQYSKKYGTPIVEDKKKVDVTKQVPYVSEKMKKNDEYDFVTVIGAFFAFAVFVLFFKILSGIWDSALGTAEGIFTPSIIVILVCVFIVYKLTRH